MATATQIKTLIKSHYEADDDRFLTVALQVAAHEAKQGHSALAKELKDLIDNSRASVKPSTFGHFSHGVPDAIVEVERESRLSSLVVRPEIKERLDRIILEYRQRSQLALFGLRHRRKILLSGPPGTGKTMTASVIANELRIPLYVILMDRILTKYMGESSTNLRQVFDFIRQYRGVYLFDEFDAIGADRGLRNDVGEMRRILNSFLQFIEQEFSDNLVIAATNNIDLLDQALFRRFDDVLYYSMPSEDDFVTLIKQCLGQFLGTLDPQKLLKNCEGLSHAEITLACLDAKKDAVLTNKKAVDYDVLEKMLSERHTIYKTKQRSF